MQDVATAFVPRLKLTVTLVSVQQAITQSVKELGYDHRLQARRQGGAGGCTCTPFFQPNNYISFHRSSERYSSTLKINCIVQQQEIFQPLLRVHYSN